ncbi:hypothetical protein [Campylobacter hyointestinalis]|uniref:Uncharacterized protein n=1 Tax=Campylobacter hyointestinalis subsp. lawsonii TaxID=91353 RepID=A0AAV6EE40_CAMHY|nr:hypothetical protein [Campylobacter hyointestinalis]KAB0610755.1 hypothetical protein F7P66_09145 [Campylobacter hyointestinalis subsp. lawsonii]RAZ27209.1 hypothetical protein CHLT_08815 [Campylobacter hyointestinalis subsp. lawsonii]
MGCRRYIYKGINLEVACEIIENQIKLNNKILIFSDNSHVANYLTSKYGNNHIIDFYNLQNGGYSLTSTQEALFELIAMSEAKIIYGTDSNFSISASYIGGVEFLNIYRIFDPKQLFDIIKLRINDDFIDKIFKGYSYYCLYRFGKKINLNLKELLTYIKKAIFYNPKNNSYYLAKLSLLLELRDFKSANEYFESYKDKLLDSYSLKRVVTNHHLKKDICSIFFDYKFINISSLEIILNIRKLLEDYYFTSSLEMIKHDIRHHVGSLFFNYKKCYINILYFTFEIKKFPTYDNSIFSSEEKLSKFNDYNTLIVSQDYFIYKIGEIIFKNINKNLYKQIKTLIILYKIINKKDSYQDKIIKLNNINI